MSKYLSLLFYSVRIINEPKYQIQSFKNFQIPKSYGFFIIPKKLGKLIFLAIVKASLLI